MKLYKTVPYTVKKHQQSGIALVTVLLLLLAITLVGITSFRLNMSDEIMARNTYLKAQAELGAQFAIRAAEQQILALAGTDNSIDKQVFFSGGNVDNDLQMNNDGDDCVNGFCTPMRYDENYSATTPDMERWVDKNSTRSLRVWSTPGRYQELDASLTNNLNLTTAPQYIIEFLGYIPDVNNQDNLKYSFCDENRDGTSAGDTFYDWDQWPFCSLDHKMYRITAYAQSGTARIMLQSTYLTP